MSSNRTDFVRVPEDYSNVTILGSLVCDMRGVLGPRAVVDFSGVTHHLPLARDCIAALSEHASPGRIASDYSLGGYGTAIRRLLEYCSVSAVPDGFRMRDINFEFLLNYRAHLRVMRAEFKTENRRRLYGDTWRLLQAGQAINLAHSDLESPCNFRTARDGDITQPYTAGEALDIEDACRNHIRRLMVRLEIGKEFLLQGKDPRPRVEAARDPVTGRVIKRPAEQRAWNQLPNLLWYVVNVMNGEFIKYAGGRGKGHSSFNNSIKGVWGGAYRKGDVYSYLYPLSEDLIPFIILLAKTTGRNESSILGLRRDCLQERDGRYILSYRKERGGAKLFRKVIPNDGPFSPVALIKQLLDITEPLVRHAADGSENDLFLGLTVRGHGRDPIKSLDPSYIKFQMNREGGWCEQNELASEQGQALKISLRRMRVYYMTKRYQRHGQLAKVSRDAAHTLSRTTVGYVHNESTKHIHERAIEEGIRAARALTFPIVLQDASGPEAAKVLGSTEEVAAKILKGEQDVYFAACRDFYNRPGGEPGVRCDKPWSCLKCSNCIITRHVLPRVLAFRDFMVQQRAELVIEDWRQKFGDAWHVLTNEVLPKFSVEALSEAERHVAEGGLYIPLAFKV